MAAPSSSRGSGFVHLNTPQSITFSPGAVVSLTELRERKQRSECVTVPCSLAAWRAGFRAACETAKLTPFIRDTDAEEDGGGVALPPTEAEPRLPQISLRGAARLAPRAGVTSIAQWPLFAVSSVDDAAATETADRRCTTADGPPSAQGTAAPSGPDSHADSSSAAAVAGITIVSHHKVSGARTFVYQDYDGVLSAGVVPAIVVTKDELEETEENKKYTISTATMTIEELDAFEELQALWKTNVASRSEQGAQYRAQVAAPEPEQSAHDLSTDSTRAAVTVPEGSDAASYTRPRQKRSLAVDELDGADGPPRTKTRTQASAALEALQHLVEGTATDSELEAAPTTADMLEEALRLSEDLLRLY